MIRNPKSTEVKKKSIDDVLSVKNIIHVICSSGKFKVKKTGSKKAIKTFDHSEQAFHFAMSFERDVCVHNVDGTVKFIERIRLIT